MNNTTTKIEELTLINTRTFENITTIDNKKIKKNKLFRSGNLSMATNKDIFLLTHKYNLKTVIDLRNTLESIQSKDNLTEEITYILNPILNEQHMGMTHEKELDHHQSLVNFVNRVLEKEDGINHMTNIYLRFINDQFCLDAYHNFIKYCIENKDGGLLFHCSVGKDRAGFAAFLLLKLLNVDTKDAIEDYLLTNTFIENNVKAAIKELKNDIDNPNLEQVYRNLYTVKQEYILALLNQIDLIYGNFDNYVEHGLKLSKEDIKQLQDIYLE